MGAGIWPSFNPRKAAIRFQTDGKVLLCVLPDLDVVAVQSGVPKLSSFCDNRPLPDGVDPTDWEAVEQALDEREEHEPWSEWFEPADGVAIIDVLAGALVGTGTLPTFAYDGEEIIAELNELKRCLLLAMHAQARFRLEVLP